MKVNKLNNLFNEDNKTKRLKTLVDYWVPIYDESDEDVRDHIEADQIDVLIDLSGYTAFNRMGVFARRAAPVQAHYLGYAASTGLTEMDYWIGDELLTPPALRDHFQEELWCLPRVWISYKPEILAPDPKWSANQAASICIGSFNEFAKLNSATISLWAKVLHAMPDAKLLLKTKKLGDLGNRQKIFDSFLKHRIISDRIELQDGSTTPAWSDHMAYYDRLDIALDPVGGVGGGTTTCDALWMGVPVITLMGETMGQRMTSTMLNAIGRHEWIAHTEAEYVDKVIELARNIEHRKNLRFTQRSRMAQSALCDSKGLATALEDAYESMFKKWYQKNNSVNQNTLK